MTSAKELAKRVIAATLSRDMQHRLRRMYLVRQALAKRAYHEPELVVLGSLIRPGDAVADIGANVGAYTQRFSALLKESGRVHAFEPVAANYDILQAVIKKAGLQNVTAHRMALGAEIGDREIAIPSMDGFTGYYWAHFARPGEHGEKVEVSTLDHLWGKGVLPDLDFIKCDVEGSELEVLQGALGHLRVARPGLLFEVSKETSDAVFGLLRGLGYQAFVYDGALVRTGGYRDKEFSNYLFFHPESKLWPRVNLQ